MNFRAPHMEYRPRQMEAWERFIAFTVLFEAMDAVQESLAGLVRRREGPIGETVGERRPPLIVQDQTPEQIFNGTLVFQPKEAPHLTLVEHPLDHIGEENFSNALAKMLPEGRFVSFWSDLDTRARQAHGYKVIENGRCVRYVELTRGYNGVSWEWEEEGDVQSFEDQSRLVSKQICRRLDRPLIFDCAKRLGLEPKVSFFARDFAGSILYWPLPISEPEAAANIADHSESAAMAKDMGVMGCHGLAELDQTDADFVKTAEAIKAMLHWDQALTALNYKTVKSAERAKTPKGRERAQWRVVDDLTRCIADMNAVDMTRDLHMLTLQFNKSMEELGTDTEAYKAFQNLFPSS